MLLKTKNNKTGIEKFIYELKNQCTIFKSEFTICKLSVKITALKEENLKLKGLIPKPPQKPTAITHLSTSTSLTQDSVNTLITDFIQHHEKLTIYRKNFLGWALGIKGAHVKEREALLKELRQLANDNNATPQNKKSRFELKLSTYIKKLQQGHSRRNLVDIEQFLTGKIPTPKALQNMWTHGFLDLGKKINDRLANPIHKALPTPSAPTIS